MDYQEQTNQDYNNNSNYNQSYNQGYNQNNGQGYNNPGTPGGIMPSNNLVWAILCTVLCCLPIGIYAIIQATKVESLWIQGNHQGAIEAANNAKKWSIIGAIAGFAALIIYLILVFVGALLESSSSYDYYY